MLHGGEEDPRQANSSGFFQGNKMHEMFDRNIKSFGTMFFYNLVLWIWCSDPAQKLTVQIFFKVFESEGSIVGSQSNHFSDALCISVR
jgi:hypothetical protein